jgi:hypothetical protein
LWAITGAHLIAQESEMTKQNGSSLGSARLPMVASALLLAWVFALASAQTAKAGADVLKICQNQIYALCAAASCFVLDDVAYCKCDIEFGNSISLAFEFDDQDICTVNASGRKNGYMVSTFSMPPSVIKPSGNMAMYTCPAETSDGAYGQCDGGVCFTSTQGQVFPGFAGKLTANEIICSCPITVADPNTAKAGYQIAGPYPCQKSFLRNCGSATANTKTGSKIPVGAPVGATRALSRLLYGEGNVPPINRCKF